QRSGEPAWRGGGQVIEVGAFGKEGDRLVVGAQRQGDDAGSLREDGRGQPVFQALESQPGVPAPARLLGRQLAQPTREPEIRERGKPKHGNTPCAGRPGEGGEPSAPRFKGEETGRLCREGG